MWRKIVQSTYRRKSLQRELAADEPHLPTGDQRVMFFIGSLAHIWGSIEALLDDWVEDIHGRGGAELIQAQLPPNLDRELDYLTSALKMELVPQTHREEAAALILRLHRIKGFRHTLIHGSLVEVLDGGKRVIVDHSRVRGSRRIRTRVTFMRPQMLRHYERALALLRDLSIFLTGKDLT